MFSNSGRVDSGGYRQFSAATELNMDWQRGLESPWGEPHRFPKIPALRLLFDRISNCTVHQIVHNRPLHNWIVDHAAVLDQQPSEAPIITSNL